MKVLDVSGCGLVEVFLFCKVFSRVYDFALEHKNGKSYLVMKAKDPFYIKA